MKVRELYSTIKRIFPDVELRYVISLINQAIESEFPDLFADRSFTTINVVSGKRFYGLPNDIQKIFNVYYQDSGGDYRIIKRLVGDVEIPDLT